jgi:hypothetical protein
MVDDYIRDWWSESSFKCTYQKGDEECDTMCLHHKTMGVMCAEDLSSTFMDYPLCEFENCPFRGFFNVGYQLLEEQINRAEKFMKQELK